MATSREVVLQTLEFDRPDRIPRQLWLLPWAQIHYPQEVESIRQRFPDDIITCPVVGEPLKTQGNAYKAGIFIDEWGCVFHNVQGGVMFMDDWGTQHSLLISPMVWRKYFKPLYKDYIDTIYATGKKAFMHSDRQIGEILPDLIELGLDAINSQIFCMDMPALSEKCKGKITFWGELDRQHMLVQGTRDDVIRAVHQVFDCFYANGGVIAQMEFGAGARPENVMTALEEWNKLSNLKQ